MAEMKESAEGGKPKVDDLGCEGNFGLQHQLCDCVSSDPPHCMWCGCDFDPTASSESKEPTHA